MQIVRVSRPHVPEHTEPLSPSDCHLKVDFAMLGSGNGLNNFQTSTHVEEVVSVIRGGELVIRGSKLRGIDHLTTRATVALVLDGPCRGEHIGSVGDLNIRRGRDSVWGGGREIGGVKSEGYPIQTFDHPVGNFFIRSDREEHGLEAIRDEFRLAAQVDQPSGDELGGPILVTVAFAAVEGLCALKELVHVVAKDSEELVPARLEPWSSASVFGPVKAPGEQQHGHGRKVRQSAN